MRRFLYLFFVVLQFGCKIEQTINRKYEYDDVRYMHINAEDVFNVNEYQYYIYYYQVDCYHCHGIKSKIIGFALNCKIPFYFIEIKEDIGFLSHDKEETIGTNNYLKSFASVTPQLSLIKGGFLRETYLGSVQILNIIE